MTPVPRDWTGPVAVLGGSFDPPHCAHVMAMSYVLSCTPCMHALVVPVYRHAFDKHLTAFGTRLAMCRAAFAPFGRRVRVLDVESRLPVPSFTVQTLRFLSGQLPDAELHLVVGTDILAEAHRWHAFDEVRRLARLLVLPRAGASPESATGPVFPDISSSAIRADVAAGRDVSDRVPAGALAIVRRKGLYAP
jgi:nicotinate-nucleotide adenylyltransferase